MKLIADLSFVSYVPFCGSKNDLGHKKAQMNSCFMCLLVAKKTIWATKKHK
jgi:hypothetical protein